MNFYLAKNYILLPFSWLSMNRMLDFEFIFTQNFDILPGILASSISANSLESLLSNDFKSLNEAWNFYSNSENINKYYVYYKRNQHVTQ